MTNELKTNEYTLVKEDGVTYLHISKELNATLLENKELGSMMVKLIEQNSVKKIIVD